MNSEDKMVLIALCMIFVILPLVFFMIANVTTNTANNHEVEMKKLEIEKAKWSASRPVEVSPAPFVEKTN